MLNMGLVLTYYHITIEITNFFSNYYSIVLTLQLGSFFLKQLSYACQKSMAMEGNGGQWWAMVGNK